MDTLRRGLREFIQLRESAIIAEDEERETYYDALVSDAAWLLVIAQRGGCFLYELQRQDKELAVWAYYPGDGEPDDED